MQGTINITGRECGPFMGRRGGSVWYVPALLLPSICLSFPWAMGIRVGPAALVLPSVLPALSSVSPGDFLPLCPHALPFPA